MLNLSNIKQFDVKFVHIIHFKIVEVQFNAAFSE